SAADSPAGGRRITGRGRSRLVVLASLATVVAALSGAALLSNRPPGEPGVIRAVDTSIDEGPARAGTMTPSTAPRDLTSQDEWRALLPRLEEEVDRHPENDTARRRLALALYNLDRLDEAQTLYEQMLAEGEDALLRNRLGNVLREKGDYAGAETAYRQAITYDPTLPAAYVNLAELLWRLRRTEEALDLLDRGMAAVAPEARPALERTAEAIREGTGLTTGD
ncbi:MAG: tetratricopeptide repeat protein, partial [Thermoleophilia bacterium]